MRKSANLPLATAIQRARRGKGLSQEDVAAQMELRGVKLSRGGLASIEAGDVELPGREVFVALCELLEINPIRLLQAAGYLNAGAGEAANVEDLRLEVAQMRESLARMGAVIGER